ncbi:hypothetical protein [Bacteroides sp.]|uniref:hypothetical protein n=1 Tax=Bacteroides sp. TaxID=29523 RepID=UPI00257E97AB|nr:hypothetical protein [Bacteroides sp.]
MAIKPILFNSEMVRAILDGRKDATRKIVKGFIPDDAVWGYTAFTPKGYISCRGTFADGYGEKFFKLPCEPGDILYVRETWEHFECCCCEGDEHGNCYREPQQSALNKSCGCYMYRATDEIYGDARWHPSIHMPKEAARIWLKVTNVRVERLQEMKPVDVIKEGAYPDCWDCLNTYGESGSQCCYGTEEQCSQCDEVMMEWEKLWNSTIKKSNLNHYGWDANPWVWVIEFERCEKPKGV